MDQSSPTPTDSDSEILPSSCSPDSLATSFWMSPYTDSFTNVAYDPSWIQQQQRQQQQQQRGFSYDDMMLDVFSTDISSMEMDWLSTRSEPAPCTEVVEQLRPKMEKRTPAFSEMQIKFSTGRRSYVASQSGEAWESRKTELHRLYIHEDRTLKDVMNTLELKGFKASAKMYKTRFKQWGFVKNNTRDDVTKMMQVRRHRAAIGKPTTFERNGKVVMIDKYLRKNGIVLCDMRTSASESELPRTVRCHTPPPEAMPTSGPLLLKELLMKCLRGLTPSFSCIKRSLDEKYSATTALWDAPRYLKLACDLFSEKRNKQAGSICNSAFSSVHTLVHPPRLDTLFNFLFSQLWWANRDITLELWRYLAAYMSNVLRIQNEVYYLLRSLIEHIDTYGYNSYLDFITECIDDILVLANHDDRRTIFRSSQSQLIGWCQLIVMDCYFINGYNVRADRVQARCARALPRSCFFPHDRKINEQLWREDFSRHTASSEIAPKRNSSRHEKFLRLAFESYAKLLGRSKFGTPAMHPSLTRIENVVGGLTRKHLDPSAISRQQQSFNLESRILAFMTRDLSQGAVNMPSEYGSYPV
ncbi:hypothetical protein BKA67DRAFT_124636 [Truncatella angustata]|uniref:Clr5 domain-containing protein n=1 Tax=Truncatella angustata TaxID=152316 RepID=A0A9P8RIT9_9PEZI|nr:uncharacterized protein BKA67DRAFT_124636 [Truncatella angustata]KAH6644911.1 hypothetical protein BKA67DRAFT_124636 [Truncatella angustata]KAH8196414.1 hypothetical protein TruAng_009430 [Truncatella angustata]